MNEYGMEYAGWELIWDGQPPFLAAGFHEDGSSLPYAIGGDDEDELVRAVQHYSGGWVLFELAVEGVPPEYQVIDGSDRVTEYGG